MKTRSLPRVTLYIVLIPDALAHIECLTSQILMSGDHAIVVGLVEGAVIREGDPLPCYDARFGTFIQLPTG